MLSEKRREYRILLLETAAAMIEVYDGHFFEETEWSEDIMENDVEMFEKEKKAVSKRIYKMADKLKGIK